MLASVLACAMKSGGHELPPGIPNPIDPHGQPTHALEFTTPAYKREAVRLLVREANKVAEELKLPETLPITESGLVDGVVNSFGWSWFHQQVGNITTSNYTYCVSQGNKFCYLHKRHGGEEIRELARQYVWPLERMDTNAAYNMATQWLASASIDVAALNRELTLLMNCKSPWYQAPTGYFVPVYQVGWCKKWVKPAWLICADDSEWEPVASLVFCMPTRELLSLDVEDPKYLLRAPVVFTNLAEVLIGPDCGVSREYIESFKPPAYLTPTNLAGEIAGANRLVISNRPLVMVYVTNSVGQGMVVSNVPESQLPEELLRAAEATNRFRHFGMEVEGAEAEEVVRAVSSARQYPGVAPLFTGWDWELWFYRGTNMLNWVRFQGRFFVGEKGEYGDESGVLGRLAARALQEAEAQAVSGAGKAK